MGEYWQLFVVLAFALLGTMAVLTLTGRMENLERIPAVAETLLGVRISCEAMVSSWFGDRIKISTR
jgi:hypothetical protein